MNPEDKRKPTPNTSAQLAHGPAVSSGMKSPTEKPTHTCKNKMLQCVNEMKNLRVNGPKDSEYNDLIQFEAHFNEWDYNLIVLEKTMYGDQGKNEPYTYITLEGIFDNIGMFARRLQAILPHGEDKTISVMDFVGELHFTIFDKGSSDYKTNSQYVARQHQLNQIAQPKSVDGHKIMTPPGKQEPHVCITAKEIQDTFWSSPAGRKQMYDMRISDEAQKHYTNALIDKILLEASRARIALDRKKEEDEKHEREVRKMYMGELEQPKSSWWSRHGDDVWFFAFLALAVHGFVSLITNILELFF